MRTTYLDPDYRKDPTSDFFCCRCQRSLNGKAHRWAFFERDIWDQVIHPDDKLDEHEGFPIGLDCARQIGIESTVKL